MEVFRRITVERAAGIGFVLALHAALLWGLWQHRLPAQPRAAAMLFVNLIAPSVPENKREPDPPPQSKPIEKPTPRPPVAETPIAAPTDSIAPPPPPAPAIAVAPAPARPMEPLVLAAELSAACPQRTPPRYPSFSRRMGEEGAVVLRVELDELGSVSAAQVSSGSGFDRLDQAALAAVRSWRCTPAQRNGQPMHSVALQTFKFILQGN